MSDALPDFTVDQFAAGPLDECDAIMKGGVTSGVVYPYAVLEIATRYRFRSLGGTSAGAIAAAFAAAAEYSRSIAEDASGFVRLQKHCRAVPKLLPDLFQPDPRFGRASGMIQRVLRGGFAALVRQQLMWGALITIGGGLIAWLIARLADGSTAEQVLAAIAGLLLSALVFLVVDISWPLVAILKALPRNNFGFCSGATVPGAKTLAVTDWLHAALQDIAFGEAGRAKPLTFGDLSQTGRRRRRIKLQMITTNLSMGRPHTLPDLGMSAGFVPAEWAEYFPPDVITYLQQVCEPWPPLEGALKLPRPSELPVVVAVRMSLSFPLLFKAMPIYIPDYEYSAVVEQLGGDRPPVRVRKVLLSDGGLSSNFPVHLFDSPLPTRPTFAISLDALQCPPDAVKRRVILPQDAITGIGVQVRAIETLGDFGWQVLSSAKDWQDQLSSQITGQRERVARIFLAGDEGGLNLAMPPGTSERLMSYGREAGQLFVSRFDFDEHKWRRLLAVHRDATRWLDRGHKVWSGGFNSWYGDYLPRVKSYKIPVADRQQVGRDVEAIFEASASRPHVSAAKFPRNTGQLRIAPRY